MNGLIQMTRIVLDVNTVFDIKDGIKTGIPRVEFAVFELLSRCTGDSVAFLIGTPTRSGFYRVTADDLEKPRVGLRPRSLSQRLRRSIAKRVGRRQIPERSAKGGSFENWRDGDCYLSISNIWERMTPYEYDEFRKTESLRIVLFCHDLAPIAMPHLYAERTRFNFTWALDALSDADLVICNSFFTQADLVRLATRNALIVSSTVVQLIAAIDQKTQSMDVVIESLKNQRFVLSVSSINDRKNYELLLRIWSAYRSDPDMQDLFLVIVGAKSWGAERVMRHLEMNDNLSCTVIHLPNVDDGQLSWLYENCICTAYPSLYEGWGLPITESLSYGKVCVASSSSSMPEASQGLGVHIHPYDFVGWKKELRKVVTDLAYRESLENLIKERFIAHDWDEIARKIVGVAIARNKCDISNGIGPNKC